MFQKAENINKNLSYLILSESVWGTPYQSYSFPGEETEVAKG